MYVYDDSEDDAEESEDNFSSSKAIPAISSPVPTGQENSTTSELLERAATDAFRDRIKFSSEDETKNFKNRVFTAVNKAAHLQTQKIDDAALQKKLNKIQGELFVLMGSSDNEFIKYSLAQREELRLKIGSLSSQMYFLKNNATINTHEIFYFAIKDRFNRASLRDYFSAPI
jgi:hypothetical protein